MSLAFLASDYYEASDSVVRHQWTAHFSILITASHVHINRPIEAV